jgi:hypothetical protein
VQTAEPEFVNLSRSPRIDSQPSGIDSLESIPGLLKRLQYGLRGQFKQKLWVNKKEFPFFNERA